MTIELWSGDIPTDAIDIVSDRLARVVKRAHKHRFPAPSLIKGEAIIQRLDDGTSVSMTSVSIVADGALRLGDYTFVGTVAALGDGSPFITYAPGVDRARVNEALVQSVNSCDHCGLVRDRKDTYLVIDVADQLSQVGSSCVKDFLGHDPAAIAGWLDAVETLTFDDEIAGWSRSATRFYEAVDVIDIAARIVAARGYVSKQKALDEGGSSTGELVRVALTSRNVDEMWPVSVESDALFNLTVDAVRASEGLNEWEGDIVRLFNAGAVQWRHVGILGSAVILGLRKQEAKVVTERGASNFIGDVGQRLEFSDVTIVMKRSYNGTYGQSFVFRMNVNESDDLLWFASWSEATSELQEGDTIRIVGTVKGHELDQRSERPTTIITRCTLKERVPAEG